MRLFKSISMGSKKPLITFKFLTFSVLWVFLANNVIANSLIVDVNKDYQNYLAGLFEYFHRNPELSNMEFNTAKRVAKELRAAGLSVTSEIGKTGIVAVLKNGDGPMVMMRADMDGLPVEEKSGLPYASTATQKDWDGNVVNVMHACGHDVHITSLVGTARYMANHKDQWSGTLMLIAQPAEELGEGARTMIAENIWQRFGKPDFALAFHVSSEVKAGKIVAIEGSPYSGVDSVDIIIHGIGAHGASPHKGKDPIVLGSQIVLALQTLVSRELAPQEPGVVTVGSFHSGTKHNIISDYAKLQLTVRNDTPETRTKLLEGIKRIAENLGRAAGLPEDKLPQVSLYSDPVPPTVNDIPLTKKLKAVWKNKMGEDIFDEKYRRQGMGAEDFPFFTTEPYIPSVYFFVGGTPASLLDQERNGGTPLPGHHSPLFKIEPEPAVTTGVQATVFALLELLQK